MSTAILPDDDLEPQSGKSSVAQQLAHLALHEYDLGIDTRNKAFGVRKGGHIAKPLTGDRHSVRSDLTSLYRKATGKIASQTAVTEAIASLELDAEEAGDPVALHLRCARIDRDEVYIDMGDRLERVLHVTGDGWDILEAKDEIPVRFRRTNVTQALPEPISGGELDLIWKFVNLGSADDRDLVKGWLAAAWILTGQPVPILALLREQGTAKTSSARSLFALIDPSAAPVRRPPSDLDRLMHASTASRSVVFDNLSSIPRWLSDGMCRYVTGEADVDRALYTDDGIRLISAQGVLGFTGIDVGALAGDLAERCVWGDLDVIPASERRSERELQEAWDDAYPSMVGGLLDLVVQILAHLPQVSLSAKPRMADFAEILAAMDIVKGTHSLDHYLRMQESVAEDIVQTDPFLTELALKVTKRWQGTGKDLYALLTRPADNRYWPEPRGIAGKLRRVAPDLRKAGWQVEEIKPDPSTKRAKSWVLVPPTPEISSTDLALVEFARDQSLLDIRQWRERFLANGATPACVDGHVQVATAGSALGCQAPGCTASWRPEYGPISERSKILGDRLQNDLQAIGMTLTAFDELVARRSTAVAVSTQAA